MKHDHKNTSCRCLHVKYSSVYASITFVGPISQFPYLHLNEIHLNTNTLISTSNISHKHGRPGYWFYDMTTNNIVKSYKQFRMINKITK